MPDAAFPLPKPEDWQALAASELRGRSLASLTRPNDDGLPIAPLYTAQDIEGLPHLGSLPGVAPYTRGTSATPRPWLVPVPVTLADLDGGLAKVELDGAFLQLDAEFASRAQLEALVRALRARGADPLRTRGTIAFDPLGDWAAAGEALEPWDQTRAESDPWLRFVAAELPLVRAIQVLSLPYHDL